MLNNFSHWHQTDFITSQKTNEFQARRWRRCVPLFRLEWLPRNLPAYVHRPERFRIVAALATCSERTPVLVVRRMATDTAVGNLEALGIL